MKINKDIFNKQSITVIISIIVIIIFASLYYETLRPPKAAPLKKEVVKNIFYSLMKMAENEYAIKPIKNLKNPQAIKNFVRSFNSPVQFKHILEMAFVENGYSYAKSLNKVANGDGVSIIMDSDGGASMILLLSMPVKGIKRKEISSIFKGQELEDIENLLGLIDKYLCCGIINDF